MMLAPHGKIFSTLRCSISSQHSSYYCEGWISPPPNMTFVGSFSIQIPCCQVKRYLIEMVAIASALSQQVWEKLYMEVRQMDIWRMLRNQNCLGHLGAQPDLSDEIPHNQESALRSIYLGIDCVQIFPNKICSLCENSSGLFYVYLGLKGVQETEEWTRQSLCNFSCHVGRASVGGIHRQFFLTDTRDDPTPSFSTSFGCSCTLVL